MAETKRVPFTTSSIGQCLCPACPVQAKSDCVSGLKKGLQASLSRDPLQREAIPALYCATGKATCTDIDPSRPCLCFGCTVFSQYGLGSRKPHGYYCRDGAPS